MIIVTTVVTVLIIINVVMVVYVKAFYGFIYTVSTPFYDTELASVCNEFKIIR